VPVPSAAPSAGLHQAVEDGFDDFRVDVPHVVIGLGEVRHDVRRGAAARDDVVHAGIRRDVLAHHVRHVVHGLDGVERGAALLGRAGGVRREAVEAELRGLVGERTVDACEVHVRGVPMHDRVHVVEEPGANHVHLAGTPFFRGRSIETDSARRAALLEPVGERNRRRNGGRPEQVVAAGMPGLLALDRLSIGHRVLVDAGKRVEFGEDPDHRLSAAGARDERGRDAGDTGLDLEARARQFLLEQRRALRFLVADFRPIPDRMRDLGVARLAGSKELPQAVAGIGGEYGGSEEGEAEADYGCFHRGIRCAFEGRQA
jgi:hypothetical protein